MGELSASARNKRAAIYGVLSGIYMIALTTIAYKQVSDPVLSLNISKGGFICFFVVLGAFAALIRKANGSYLEFKQTFGSIFIMILISGAMYYIYNYIYIEYIDPKYMYAFKDAQIAAMKNAKPDEIRKMMGDIDSQIEFSKKFSLGNNLFVFCEMILKNSLIGLIVAFVVKKKPAEA